ncbi:serine/threonine protein kinase [Catenulispora sp. NL8]|uniref:non-specific serine/threonine protein kinase n=1 Tax=Catenulispora pinistramenti TaxID=2705254 RepID=A0ABS5KMN9_9ACTN|nr:serine/threonine-protein kinase [Catenulispora pinistramenti]MBS2547320.1 serine/threonine protein kinase [Catenulispora pinistramenti]
MSEAGQVIAGRYQLLSMLGSGGMGRVWRARDKALDVHVAIKEVQLDTGIPAAERDELLARAQREARNAAQLRDHPNVVAVYDVLIEDARPWIVMRLIHGMSVADLLAQHGSVSAEATTRVARALLDALNAAHKVGIVHRDVKPGNVLLTEDGRVLLTDFGIARRSGDTAMTSTGKFIGSLEYMAPERMRGTQEEPSSDLFSLGVTLYHMVTGRSPFRRDNPAASMSAVLVDEPSPPEPPGTLAELIMALLVKDPAERPSAAQAISILAAPQQPPARPKKVFDAPAVIAPASMPTRLLRTIKGYKGSVLALAFSPSARFLAAAGTDGMVRLWDPAKGILVRTLPGHRGEVRCVAYKWDGSRLATGGEDATVRLWNPANSRHRELNGHALAVTALAFSPDGRLLASGGLDGRVALWNTQTGALVRVLTEHSGEVQAVSFSPDGTVLGATGGKSLFTWDPVTGNRLRNVRFEDADLSCFAYGPGGEVVFARRHSGRQYLAAIRTGGRPEPLTAQIKDLCSARLSPDRQTIVTSAGSGTVHLWQVANRHLVAKLDAHRDAKHPGPALDAVLSRGNALLAISGGKRLWIYAQPQ